jgi:hypothetical protein
MYLVWGGKTLERMDMRKNCFLYYITYFVDLLGMNICWKDVFWVMLDFLGM